MKRVFVAALCLLVAASRPAIAQQPSIPDVIPVPKDSGPSLWVSARAAADSDTVVKWDLFGETTATDSLHGAIDDENKRVEHPRDGAPPQVVEIPEADCPTMTISSSFSEGPDPSLTIRKMVARSAAGIYSGTVVAVTPGFYREVPAELVTINVDQLLTPAAGPKQAPTEIHLFYGVAHFRIGSYYFCGRKGDGQGDPTVGKRILIFADGSEQPGTGRFISNPENELIFETAHSLHMPAALRRNSKLDTFDAAVAAVHQATAEVKP